MAAEALLQKIFVYGTLKRGGSLHHHMAGAVFLGAALTRPAYRLFRIDWYPALVEVPVEGQAIHGEVWHVEPARLRILDDVEEVDQGLYERRRVQLAGPFEQDHVEAWFYLRSVSGCADCGPVWVV